jgi:hypothetical protein
MNRPDPIIKSNGGNPIALCNRCFAIMCYVDCDKNAENCKVIEVRSLNGVKYTRTSIGNPPPPYCDVCDLLFTYSLNE